jgi:hypothetical protein
LSVDDWRQSQKKRQNQRKLIEARKEAKGEEGLRVPRQILP